MFSYRHAFHCGNHADVLKHTALLAVMNYMTEKAVGITVLDSHAGAGLYRLDGQYARTSQESDEGVLRLLQAQQNKEVEFAPALENYLNLLKTGNPPEGPVLNYPGSPLLVQSQLRPMDRLKAFELHPTDGRLLAGTVRRLGCGRQVEVVRDNGFSCITKFFPPPTRRGLLVCDPSYEMKTDYAQVLDLVAEGLLKFATGTYFIWYPIIARSDAHDLPKRLKTMANRAGRNWLDMGLTIKGAAPTRQYHAPEFAEQPEDGKRVGGLPGSGVFVINPPFTLKDQMKPALEQMVALLGQDKNAMFKLESN